MWDIVDESKYSRLEQIRHNIKDFKALVKFWEKLETEEIILLDKKLKDKHER